MRTPAFIARQLAHPHGFFGRFVMGPMLNRQTREHTTMVLEDLAVAPAHRVLEVGFGGGSLLERLCRAASDGLVVGVDVSDEMLALARVRLRGLIDTGRLEVRHASVERLPYPDGTFDRGCTVNTTYFWPDLAAGLVELHRVLRPGARFVVGFVSPEDICRGGLDQHGFSAHSPDQLAADLEAAGFLSGALRSGRDVRGTYYSLSAERVETALVFGRRARGETREPPAAGRKPM